MEKKKHRKPAGDDSVQGKAEVGLFFSGAQRRKLLEELKKAVVDGVAVITLAGEEGTGKTILCRMLEKELPDGHVCVYLPDNLESFDDVVRVLALALGTENSNEPESTNLLVEEISSCLKENGQKMVVIFDQAERMYIATIERIRRMLDQVNAEEILLQLVFSGRKNLLENLQQLTIINFKKAKECSFSLTPLGLSETYAYLNHSAQEKTGSKSKNIFTPEAAKKIYSMAKGNMRLTSMLAAKSLEAANTETSFMVLLDSVIDEESEKEIKAQQPQVRSYWWLNRWSVGASGVAFLLIILFNTVFKKTDNSVDELVDNTPIIEKQEVDAVPSIGMSEPVPNDMGQSKNEDEVKSQPKFTEEKAGDTIPIIDEKGNVVAYQADGDKAEGVGLVSEQDIADEKVDAADEKDQEKTSSVNKEEGDDQPEVVIIQIRADKRKRVLLVNPEPEAGQLLSGQEMLALTDSDNPDNSQQDTDNSQDSVSEKAAAELPVAVVEDEDSSKGGDSDADEVEKSRVQEETISRDVPAEQEKVEKEPINQKEGAETEVFSANDYSSDEDGLPREGGQIAVSPLSIEESNSMINSEDYGFEETDSSDTKEEKREAEEEGEQIVQVDPGPPGQLKDDQLENEQPDNEQLVNEKRENNQLVETMDPSGQDSETGDVDSENSSTLSGQQQDNTVVTSAQNQGQLAELDDDSETFDADINTEDVEPVVIAEIKKRIPALRTQTEDESKRAVSIAPVRIGESDNDDSVLDDGESSKQLFEQRVIEGQKWLERDESELHTIQLMVLTASEAEENMKKNLELDEYKGIADKLYFIKNDQSNFFVFYGEYESPDVARQARNTLPLFLRKYDPYPLSINDAVNKVKRSNIEQP